MIRAVIDIGSNSIKMRLAEIKNGRVNLLRDETEVVRLGRGMTKDGTLSLESMKISCGTVLKMVKTAQKFQAEIFIAGTMALRSAKNSEEFLKMVKDATGFEVHVLSGEDEAKYSWLGAVDGFNFPGDVIMFDTGGGSTEFVCGSGGAVKKIVSVPIGAVIISEKFFNERDKPIKKSLCNSAIEYIKAILLENKIDTFKIKGSKILGVGGGVVTMASVKFACETFCPTELHGSELNLRDVARQIELYAALTLKERENIIGLPASRADIILGSACIVFSALKILEAKSCIVSINGLRNGLLIAN